MRKCSVIVSNDNNEYGHWKKNDIYLYEIINNLPDNHIDMLYPYHIYTLDRHKIATFSNDVFYIIFEDILITRSKKIERINEKIKSNKAKNS